MRKVYVEVIAKFSRDGKLTPLSFVWDNERKFNIDRILDVTRAASVKAGGIGIRYTIKVAGKESYLYYENPAWFMEGKD